MLQTSINRPCTDRVQWTPRLGIRTWCLGARIPRAPSRPQFTKGINTSSRATIHNRLWVMVTVKAFRICRILITSRDRLRTNKTRCLTHSFRMQDKWSWWTPSIIHRLLATLIIRYLTLTSPMIKHFNMAILLVLSSWSRDSCNNRTVIKLMCLAW